MGSKVVYIKRVIPFVQGSNKELEEYFSYSHRDIGSYFVKGSIKSGTGLTPTETNILMEHVLDLPSTDRDFRKQVENFFNDITTKVSAKEGRRFEIGLHDNDMPLSKDNLPENIEDYIRYKHALGHPQVAKNSQEAEGNQLILFYVEDDAFNLQLAVDLRKEKDNAMRIYLEVKDDAKKVDRILTNLGIDTRKFNEEERVNELDKIKDSNPKGFTRIAEDKNLDSIAAINKLIQAGILEKVGGRILNKEDGEELGADMKEAVLFWNDQTKSREVGILKARYSEFVNKNK